MMRVRCEGIYAALFEFNLARWSGNEQMASFLTAIGLGGVMAMNILLIIGIAVDFVGPLTFIPRGVLEVFSVSPIALSYWAFIPQNRYADVVQRFRRRSASEQRRARIVAWSYVLLSLLAPFLTVVGFPKH